MANRWGKNKNSYRLYFLGFQNHPDGDCSHKIKKMISPWKESYDKPRQHIKKQGQHFANKGQYSQSYGFPVMYGCESRTRKKAEY